MNKIKKALSSKKTVTVVWILGIIVIWEIFAFIVAATKRTPVNVLPHLTEIIGSFFSDKMITGKMTMIELIGMSCAETLSRAGIGFLIGTLLGYLLALLMNLSRIVEKVAFPYLMIIQMIPILGMAPIILSITGDINSSRIVIAAILTFYPVSTNVLAGFKAVEREKHELMFSYAANKLQLYTKTLIPAYAPVLERRGFHDDDEYIMLAAGLTHKERAGTAGDWRRLRYIARKICADSRFPACIFVQENYLIVVRQHFSVSEADKLAVQLAGEVIDAFPERPDVYIGISDTGLGYEGIYTCYREAISAMRLAEMKKYPVAHYKDIGVYKLLFGVESSKILYDYVYSTLGILFDYDEKNNTDYAKLLKCYFENSGSVMEAAKAIGIHRNTVNYKIKQIRDLLGSSFSDEDKMKFLLAFHAKELLDMSKKTKTEDESNECI